VDIVAPSLWGTLLCILGLGRIGVVVSTKHVTSRPLTIGSQLIVYAFFSNARVALSSSSRLIVEVIIIITEFYMGYTW